MDNAAYYYRQDNKIPKRYTRKFLEETDFPFPEKAIEQTK